MSDKNKGELNLDELEQVNGGAYLGIVDDAKIIDMAPAKVGAAKKPPLIGGAALSEMRPLHADGAATALEPQPLAGGVMDMHAPFAGDDERGRGGLAGAPIAKGRGGLQGGIQGGLHGGLG